MIVLFVGKHEVTLNINGCELEGQESSDNECSVHCFLCPGVYEIVKMQEVWKKHICLH